MINHHATSIFSGHAKQKEIASSRSGSFVAFARQGQLAVMTGRQPCHLAYSVADGGGRKRGGGAVGVGPYGESEGE
ncbi:hypothetical protein RIF29_14857 [Crotalaria pallida]|uniref:Uncharacterized protein n=1 Tax=Crotalaria pallida TaxID=3830 RepID=A0AAN9FCH5_CROPI